MKYLSTFIIAALIAGAGVLIYRSADLSGDVDAEAKAGKDESSAKQGSVLDHAKMNHAKSRTPKTEATPIDHSQMDHSKMDHSKKDDAEVDHSKMDHSKMDHGKKKDAEAAESDDTSIAGRMKLNAHDMNGLTHLLNSLDPVSGNAIEGTPTNLEYQGFLIAFNSEKTADKFKSKPLRYFSRLSLEYVDAENVKLVDASSYKTQRVTNCFSMGGEIDYDDDVYLLHRGFKFYFCCWPGGCGGEFIEDPSAAYEHYKLKEIDGKLVSSQ